MKRLKIAYVTGYDAGDVNNWSGTAYYIAQALAKHIGTVDYIGNLKTKKYIRHIFKKIYNRCIFGKSYYHDRSGEIGRYYAKQVTACLKNNEYDLIFSPGTIPIAYLETNVPVVFWTDATFAAMTNYYFMDLCKETVEDGNNMEKRALDNCMLAVYSSHWAAQSAIEEYGVQPSKIEVIPFGANIENIPNKHEIKTSLSQPLQLLFIGKDWARKGGKKAFQTLVALNDMGIESRLTIVGCVPSKNYQHDGLIVYPFLNKNNISDAKKLHEIFKKADFLLLPSRKECAGIVLCEANAFGIAVLTTNTGGIPTIVKDGVNGFLLSKEASGVDYAGKIKEVILDKAYYSKLRRSARERYDDVLNWDAAGEHLKDAISQRM